MPVTDELQISGAYEGQVIITDITGKIVLQSTLNQAKAIPCVQLKAGLYLLNLETENRTYKSKFIKL